MRNGININIAVVIYYEIHNYSFPKVHAQRVTKTGWSMENRKLYYANEPKNRFIQ